jgi:antagonist of KipI
MSLLVTKEGMLSTVQDMGRYGYQACGVNPGGVMDRAAARLINLLLGNCDDRPVFELHFPAGEFLFERNVYFAIGGAEFSPELSNKPISNWTVYQASKGDLLRFSKRVLGNRSYVAVKAGFSVPRWLGSASTSLVTRTGGFEGRRLQVGDRIMFDNSMAGPRHSNDRIGPSILPIYSTAPRVRVIAGPEFDMVTGVSQHRFFTEEFTVSQLSDRMGFRLKGPPLHRLSDDEILSSGTTFGTIQLLPDGQMIVLMADHQTTGGYPRIASVISVDLPLIAQLGPGNKISFQLIEPKEAEDLIVSFENHLVYLRTGLRVRSGSL